jgi:hypothetical protein
MQPGIEEQRRRLASVIAADPGRMRALAFVLDLDLPDCWIGGGFVRSAIWNDLHGRAAQFPDGDVDVIWFDAARTDPAIDREIEARLTQAAPELEWSVKNQTRMHLRNGDDAYADTQDAMRRWLETATAVAVRLGGTRIESIAPFGLDDLFALTIRPTPAFADSARSLDQRRERIARWQARWPKLVLADG